MTCFSHDILRKNSSRGWRMCQLVNEVAVIQNQSVYERCNHRGHELGGIGLENVLADTETHQRPMFIQS